MYQKSNLLIEKLNRFFLYIAPTLIFLKLVANIDNRFKLKYVSLSDFISANPLRIEVS